MAEVEVASCRVEVATGSVEVANGSVLVAPLSGVDVACSVEDAALPKFSEAHEAVEVAKKFAAPGVGQAVISKSEILSLVLAYKEPAYFRSSEKPDEAFGAQVP